MCFAAQSVQIAVECCVQSRFLAAAAACAILRIVNVFYSGCMKVANGALAADFSPFWRR